MEPSTHATDVSAGETTPEGGSEAMEALQRFEKAAVSFLLEKAASGERIEREAALRALEERGDEALPVLLEALKEDDPERTRVALEQIGRIGSREAVTDLLAAIRRSRGPVRGAAVRALGKIEDPEVTVHLIRLLDDDSRFIRWNAAEELARRGESGIEALIGALETASPSLSESIRRVLRSISGERGLESEADWRTWWERRRQAPEKDS